MRKSFYLSGSFTEINDGTITPIRDTGLFRVQDRTAKGILADDEDGGLESDIEGTFSMTYDAIIAIVNQKGPFWGRFEIRDDEEDEDYTALFRARSMGELQPFDPEKGLTMEINIAGHLTFVDNARGGGNFKGAVEVALDEQGHIVGIVESDLMIKGYWNPDTDNRQDHPFMTRWDRSAEGRWSDHIADRWGHLMEDQENADADAVVI